MFDLARDDPHARALVDEVRRTWDADLPLHDVWAAAYPKVVVPGGHSAAFDAICDALAQQIGARHEVVAGVGHEIQFTGAPLNALLLELWTEGGATAPGG